MTADLLGRMPPASVSLAGGILAGAQSLSLLIISPVIGKLVGGLGNYDAVAWLLGGWVVPGSMVWLLWRPGGYEPRSIRSGSDQSGL